MTADDSSSRPRVLIVDDEPLARRFLDRLLERSGAVGEVRQSANGVDARDEIARFSPHILFLDVEMPGLSGADLLGSLPPQTAPVTVFTTAYSEYAVRAFELAACDYLLKPFDEARFAISLDRALASVERSGRGRTPRLAVKSGSLTVLLDAEEIVCVASEDNYVSVRARGRTFLHRSTLDAVEEAVSGCGFERVHRGFLVNLAHVRGLSRADPRRLELRLSDGSSAPVSRARRDRVKALLLRGPFATP
jgi:two-component system LytT family response regulator